MRETNYWRRAASRRFRRRTMLKGAGRRAWPGRNAVFSDTPAEVRKRAPMLGEHNRFVATELLGYSESEYDELEARGAFGTLPLAAHVKPAAVDPAGRVQLPIGAFGRSKLHDADHMERLKARFGDEYGEDIEQ